MERKETNCSSAAKSNSIPNSSSIAVASVTPATESHRSTVSKLAEAICCTLSSGKTAAKHRVSFAGMSFAGGLFIGRLLDSEENRWTIVKQLLPGHRKARLGD